MSGRFVVSLDFELHWGVPERSLSSYGSNLLGERRVVPEILNLFREFDIHATWATVGFLFARNREELLAHLPNLRPRYVTAERDPYLCIDSHLGSDESTDPYHFATSLLDEIAATAHQEVATHTFSHYYCLDPGQDVESFRDDLNAALKIASARGAKLTSIVFPKNQVNRSYLSVCRSAGLSAYRGNLRSWLYRERERESLRRRAARLVDTYVPLSGDNSYTLVSVADSHLVDIPASRFLRPWSSGLRWLDWLRRQRITADMTRAAKHGCVYHLWWHPHNFGAHMQRNLGFLREILNHFAYLRHRFEMRSVNMAELTIEARSS